jgi:L-ribulose-5-phosphate 3-epimerase
MSGCRLGANTFSYVYKQRALDCLRHLGSMGYREFEILVTQPHFWATDFSVEERRDIPKKFADEGLHVTSVNIPGLDNNIVSGTREMREFTIKILSDLVDICGDWNIPYCILVPGRTIPLFPIPKEQLTEWFVEGMTALAKRASDQGVTLLIENVPNTWIPRAENVMEALDAVGRDDIGVIYDVANAPFAGEDPREGVKIVKDRLKLVHLSDTHKNTWRHDPIGMGDVPFEDFNKVLHEIGYDGISMLEIITDDPDFHFVDSRNKLVEMGWVKF